MATTIQHKRSNTASSVPTAGSLAEGEIAINMADAKIYTKNPAGTVIELGGGSSGGTGTPAGVAYSLQWNAGGGNFGGSANLTYNVAGNKIEFGTSGITIGANGYESSSVGGSLRSSWYDYATLADATVYHLSRRYGATSDVEHIITLYSENQDRIQFYSYRTELTTLEAQYIGYGSNDGTFLFLHTGNTKTVNGASLYDTTAPKNLQLGLASKAEALLNSAASSFNYNPHALPLYTGPAVLTTSTTKPNECTRTYTIESAGSPLPGHPFRFGGNAPTASSGFFLFYSTDLATSPQQFLWRVETIVDSEMISFNLGSSTTDGGYRFIVDGQYLSEAGALRTGDGWYTITWPSRGMRRVIVEGCGATSKFGQVATTTTGKLIRPFADGLHGYFIGDSNAQVSGFNQKGNSYAKVMMDHLGITRSVINALYGTGFVAANVGSSRSYAGREADWNNLQYEPDVIFFQMSVNDINESVPTVTLQASVAARLAAARAAWPNALIVALGIVTWDESGVEFVDHENAAAAEVAATGDPYIIFVPVRTAADEEIFTGSASAVDGTASYYVNDVAGHLNYDGNKFLGKWLAERVVDRVSAAIGARRTQHVPTPTPTPVAKVYSDITVAATSARMRNQNTGGGSATAVLATVPGNDETHLITIAHYSSIAANRIASVTFGGVSAELLIREQSPLNTDFSSEIWMVRKGQSPVSSTVVVGYTGAGNNWTDWGFVSVRGLDEATFGVGRDSGTGQPVSAKHTMPQGDRDKFYVACSAGEGASDAHVWTVGGTATEMWNDGDSLSFMAGAAAYNSGGASPTVGAEIYWTVSPALTSSATTMATFYAEEYVAPAIHVGTTAPANPYLNQLWVDIS